MGHGFATSLKTHLTPLQFLSFRRAEHGNLHQVGPLKDFQDNPWDFWSWKSPKNGAGAPLPPHPVGSPGATHLPTATPWNNPSTGAWSFGGWLQNYCLINSKALWQTPLAAYHPVTEMTEISETLLHSRSTQRESCRTVTRKLYCLQMDHGSQSMNGFKGKSPGNHNENTTNCR